MNYLLKIVEGPNKGAEIALVEGVAVTLGKGDECDIVLADATMPDEPAVIQATFDGVTVGGEPLEQFHVKTLGATSFAVGQADAPWGELVWPKAAEEDASRRDAEAQSEGDSRRSEAVDGDRRQSTAEKEPAGETPAKKRRGCGCGCFLALAAMLLVLAGLAWFFRDKIKETGYVDRIRDSRWTKKVVAVSKGGYARTSELVAKWMARESQPTDAKPPALTLSDIAAKYGLSLSEDDGAARLSGNFRTRRERLAAAAEAYSVRPGADLDLSDDESFRASAEDALFTLTEGALKVSSATNRVLKIVGRSPSAAALKKTLVALNSDLSKLRDVDVSGVAFGAVAHGHETTDERRGDGAPASSASRHRPGRRSAPSFPVCGILTTPYPCLVMRDGRRVMEGAQLGDSVIQRIDADSVVLTNSTGRFTWKP